MKFILFSDSEDRRGKILSIFAEKGREIIYLKDPDLLLKAVESSNFPVVLVDVKFARFPAFKLSRELKERFPEKNMKIFLIMPSVERGLERNILDLWLADGIIPYSELDEEIKKLLNRFPLVKRGNFKEKPFLNLLLEIQSRAFSGTLTVTRGGDEKAVYFEKGIPRYAITSRREEKIGEFLLRHGKLTADALEKFLDEARNSGRRLGEFLIEKGIIEREEFRKILQHQMEEIFESIFAWDDADYTLSTENIALLEDVLIERDINELIYSGVMRYAEAGNSVKDSYFPRLLVNLEEIYGCYPLNQKERELLGMFSGRESIKSLSFKSECTLKEIQRLCYLLKETGKIELLLSPPEEVSKAVIGRIETETIKVEPSIAEERPVLPSEQKVKEATLSEGPRVELQPPYKAPAGIRFLSREGLKKAILVNSLITISMVLIISLSAGLIVKKRAEERLLNEKIKQSHELIRSDSLPALKNASKILSDCVKRKMNPHVIGLLAFAYIRIFELTGDRGYLEEAKKILQSDTIGDDESAELKSLILLISMAEGDMAGAERVLNEIKGFHSPLSLYSQARYMLNSSGDAERVREILSSVREEDMRAISLELANAWSLSGDLERLREMLAGLQKEIPGHPDVIMLKGDEKFLEGNYKEAEMLYRLSLDARPGHVQTTIRLARAHLAMNEAESVVEELEPLLATTDIKTHCGKLARLFYARALQRLNKLESAKAIFSQLAGLYPQDDAIRNDLSAVEKMITRKESAEKKKEETVSDLLRRAKKLYNDGKYEKAIKVFERGLDRADDEFLYWYALTLMETGNSTAAFLQLKKAEGINPENPLVHKELGRLYKERGNEEESLKHFKLYMQYLKK